MLSLPEVISLVQKIEGPYKWYVIAGIIAVLTLFFTRFVFKTIKWFLMIVALGVLVTAAAVYFF